MPLRTGNTRFLNQEYLGDEFDEAVWSMRQMEQARRAQGLRERDVAAQTFIQYVDQLSHLNETYNRSRQLRRHEDPAGLLVYPIDDADDDSKNNEEE